MPDLPDQSSNDHWIGFRLVKYSLLLLERFKDDQKKQIKSKLPLIYTAVIYNGSRKYSAPRNFFDLFNDPETAKDLFNKDYHLIDLQAIKDEELKKKNSLLGMFEFMLKPTNKANILDRIKSLLHGFKPVITDNANREGFYIKTYIWYISTKLPKEERGAFSKLLKDNYIGGEDMKGSLAEAWMEEGVEKGITQGISQGITQGISQGITQGISQGISQGITQGISQGISQTKIKIAKNMLARNLDMNIIASVTGLTRSEIKKLASQN